MLDAPFTTLHDHRLKRRKGARPSLKLTVRRGVMGLGPDISLGITNLTEDGIGFRCRDELARGEEVEIILTKPGQNRTLKMIADICWCSELTAVGNADPTYMVGARLRKRIAYADLTTFC